MTEHEELINIIDEVIKSGVGSSDYMIGRIEMSIDLFRQQHPEKKTIKQIVAKYFNLHETDLCIVTRDEDKREARQIAMYFYRKYTNMSLKLIGAEFRHLKHKFDHSTASNAIDRINDLIDSDKRFKAKIEEIEEQVKLHY